MYVIPDDMGAWGTYGRDEGEYPGAGCNRSVGVVGAVE